MGVREAQEAFGLIRAAAEDSGEYYLIGWDPGAGKPAEYRRVQIRMRDRSLRARARDGYFARLGTIGPQTAPPERERMRQALTSAFRSGDLDLRLTASFQRQEAAGSYVASLVRIAASGVRFDQDAGGCWNARLELARALWPVDPGVPASDRIYASNIDVHACGEEAERMRRDGLIAAVEDRVPSPGAYQVRVAARNIGDEAAVGAATQFLAIPDLRQGGPALSGVTLWSGEGPPAAGADVSYRASREGDPGVRRFRTGDSVHYAVRVFGAAGELRLRVLREGQEVWSDATAKPVGLLELRDLAAGPYVLVLTASSGRGRPAEQSVDFEVTR